MVYNVLRNCNTYVYMYLYVVIKIGVKKQKDYREQRNTITRNNIVSMPRIDHFHLPLIS